MKLITQLTVNSITNFLSVFKRCIFFTMQHDVRNYLRNEFHTRFFHSWNCSEKLQNLNLNNFAVFACEKCIFFKEAAKLITYKSCFKHLSFCGTKVCANSSLTAIKILLGGAFQTQNRNRNEIYYTILNNRKKLYFQHFIFIFTFEYLVKEEECNFMITFTVDVRVYKFLDFQLNSLSLTLCRSHASSGNSKLQCFI